MAFGNLYNALKFAFPEYKLDPDRFLIRSKKSNQKYAVKPNLRLMLHHRLLESILHTVFPGYEIKESFLHPELSWSTTSFSAVADKIQMAQAKWSWTFGCRRRNSPSSIKVPPKPPHELTSSGEQHYHELGDIFGPHGSLYSYMARDNKKRIECEKAGISLAVVPYWWDGEQASLSDLLREENILH